MNKYKVRKIKETEYKLIKFLLNYIKTDTTKFPISQTVYEYEGGKMGSINLINENATDYKGDIAVAQYIDKDGVIVMITLTIDKNNNLLDLDFWKVNFEKLLKYPSPEELILENFKEVK